jgi:carboxyl-terminal processing protease
VSRYDDPRWYEEQHVNPGDPPQPAYDDFDQYGYNNVPRSEDNQQNGRVLEPYEATRSSRLARIVGQLLALIALVIIAFCGGWFSHQYFSNSFQANDQSKSYAQLFQQAWTTVDQNYVDRKQVDYKTMSYAAIQAMVDSLKDKGHTRFLTPEQVKNENQQLSGKFTGVGIYLRQDTNSKQLIITGTIPGSPAEKANLKRGDVIISVNGTDVKGKDVNGVSSLIQGKEGSNVSLTVQRSGVAQPITVTLKRAVIQVPNVIMHYIAESHIAHIQIVQFSDNTSGQLKSALAEAKSKGATKIILDLRDNPGGYLNEAVNTASLFMKDGTVLLEQDSSGKQTPILVTGNAVNTTDTLVVLINGNSASAAEIVSGALHDNKRATLIGETTFGTGTVLQQFTLSDGSALLLGTQEWLTPKGHFIRENGIAPDITVKLPTNATQITPGDENNGNMTLQQILNGGDTQLSAAIKYLQNH